MLDLAVVDLAARPDLAGQVFYLFAQARVLLPKTSLDLAADVGAGWQRSSGFETNEAKNGWRVFGYQVTLPRAPGGKVTLGLQVVSEAGAAATGESVELGAVVVAPVGHEWSRLL